jgi:phosphatidylserine/phosphatidylglycerophosphate/cardiolipin synthase-like enzyme
MRLLRVSLALWLTGIPSGLRAATKATGVPALGPSAVGALKTPGAASTGPSIAGAAASAAPSVAAGHGAAGAASRVSAAPSVVEAPISAAAEAAIARARAALPAWQERETPGDPDTSHDAAVPLKSYDYGRMFDLTRDLLTRAPVQAFVKKAFKDQLAISEEMQERYGLPAQVKEMSESQLMLLLALNPQHWPLIEQYLQEVEKAKTGSQHAALHRKWTAKFAEIIKEKDVAAKFQKLNDATRPMRLEWPDGKPGYANARIHFSHERLTPDGQMLPPGDLKKALIDFIGAADKELMFNVFDFDLMDVADAMIAAADKGVKITGGIDKRNIDGRPDVKAVFDKLSRHKNISIRAVDSVGLNHQKLVVRDWSDKEKAASLLSSGNFTQSCIGPEGDLVGLPVDRRGFKTRDSVPNANHLVTMDGYLPAQVIANKLTQTLVMGLRGKEYPLGGAFRVSGEKPKDGGEAPFIVLSFSPKGTIGDVSRDMIRRLHLETRGSLRDLVFAYSSQTEYEATLERARREVAEGHPFDLAIIGDTPFTMRDYSVPLKLAGLAVKALKKGKKYVDLAANELRKIVGAKYYDEKLRSNLRIAPRAYGEHTDGEGHKFNAKIHHKVFVSGAFAIVGSSFNPSDNAEHNNEQIMVTNDPAFVQPMRQGFDALFGASERSIHEEARRRNERGEVSSDDVGDQYKHNEDQARGKAKAKKKPAKKRK